VFVLRGAFPYKSVISSVSLLKVSFLEKFEINSSESAANLKESSSKYIFF